MSQPVEFRPERELRLAVVMYGGVSLAIYMNGVAQELLNLVLATAPDPKDPLKARFGDADLPGRSAAVYREVARIGGGPAPAVGPIRQRVVVDILSGTSAGGINAIYLAKALANQQSVDGLAQLWETEADLGLLINDGESRKEVAPALPAGPPRSLLNSRRMYLKLRDAFGRMDEDAPQPRTGLVEELDLFVTTTDITGLPVQLQLGGGEIAEERRYRKAFHLRFKTNPNGDGPAIHDFTAQDNPFLAFIARCTSSFPFAFEPMQLAQAEEWWLREKRIGDRSRWARHFAEYGSEGGIGGRWEQRPFGDGGYLDNKPFSYALDTIAQRSGSRTARVERKLVFVDPAPERVLREDPAAGTPAAVPNAVENVLTAFHLPAYETIREDLLRLRERNRLVDKVQSVVLGVTDDFNRLEAGQAAALVELLNDRAGFKGRDLNTVVPLFGAAYGGYHRLKVGNLTDELGSLLAAQAGIPLDSDASRLLRFLVRAWRDLRYCRNPAEERARAATGGAGDNRQTEFAFLEGYDLSYRVRRLAFVIEQINRLSSASVEERRQTIGCTRAFGEDALAVAGRWQVVLDELHQRRRRLVELLGELRDGREKLYAPRGASLAGTSTELWQTIRRGIEELARVRGDRARKTLASSFMTEDAQGLVTMQALQDAIARVVADLSQRAREGCAGAVVDVMQAEIPARPAKTPAGLADNIVRHFYAWYELYDSMVFPIVHGSEVGEEIATVEPVRISPLTGTAGSGGGTMDPRFLPAGVALGHFGGFLNAEWRSRDILLGRLNAAQKLIQMLLTGALPEPAPGQPDTRDEMIRDYIHRAWKAIIAEELERRDRREDPPTTHPPLEERTENSFGRFLREGLPKEELSRQRSLDWLTRSVRVSGRIFDLAADGSVAKKLTGILVRAGQILTAIGEVAVPRHWWGLLYRRWVAQLWVFGVLLALLGLLFGQAQMRQLGLEVAGVVTGFGTLALLVQGWALRSSWLRRLRLAQLALVLALVIVGALHLWSLREVPLDWLGRVWDRVIGPRGGGS